CISNLFDSCKGRNYFLYIKRFYHRYRWAGCGCGCFEDFVGHQQWNVRIEIILLPDSILLVFFV
ncbi:MAG: hypothetical protein K2K95_10870, partial [Muribaculaceae bacterium]|nr:hypothetical protein [Muribaculaceae bacterium]